jgi:GT2 family glycosyltransferase
VRMNVSIVIVNWNTCNILKACLQSAYSETKEVQFEVIVVDNGSADGSVEMIKAEFPQVILIENAENRGFAAANNQGIAISKGKYVLVLNSDTIILDNAISKAVFFADKHSDAAVIGCRILNPDKTLQPSCFMFPSVLNMILSSSYLYKVFPTNQFFGRERMTWWNRDDEKEVDVATGCFMLVRKEAIDRIGSMDEDFFMYAEETDWCCRFKQAGWKILFTPSAEIIHLGGQSSNQMKPQMQMQLRAGILLFMKKHKNIICYITACILTSIFFALRIPYWFIKSLFSDDREDCLQTTKTYFIASIKTLGGWKTLSYK